MARLVDFKEQIYLAAWMTVLFHQRSYLRFTLSCAKQRKIKECFSSALNYGAVLFYYAHISQ